MFGITRHAVGNRGEVYRRGGEELIVLLPYCDLNASKQLAELIREEVEKTGVSYDSETLSTTLSIGVAASPPRDPDGPALETHAENALKRAKSKGKNRVLVDR